MTGRCLPVVNIGSGMYQEFARLVLLPINSPLFQLVLNYFLVPLAGNLPSKQSNREYCLHPSAMLVPV